MADNDEIRRCVVGGYQFEDAKDYEDAVNEKKAIKYLEGHVNLNDTAKVLQLYNTLLAKNMFRTPIGLEYMRRLRSALQKSSAGKEELPFVRVPSSSAHEDGGENSQAGFAKAKEKAAAAKIKELEVRCRKIKDGRRNSVILNIILIILIIAMFVIAGNSSTPNIVNYERVLTDKYSSWKEELMQKEEELRQRERELEQRESEAFK